MKVETEERKKWEIRPGATIKVWQKIKEGDKTRLQAFEGMVIAHKHGYEPGATFTVRKISEGIGVERIFPVFSPNIEKVELLRRSKARRAKLYFVREKAAKEIRRKMKHLKAEGKNKVEPIAEKETAVSPENSQKREQLRIVNDPCLFLGLP